MRSDPRRGAMPLRRPRMRAWERQRPDPWGESCGAGAGGGCDPAHALRLPGLGGRGRLGSGRPRCRREAASGLSRAPIPSGIRSAARERVAAARKPRGDVAAESRSLFLGDAARTSTPHHHPRTRTKEQQPICRSGVGAAARNRPDLRTSNSRQAMPRA